MTIEEINEKITELELVESEMNSSNRFYRDELAKKELEINQIKIGINQTIFNNTKAYLDLEGLRTAKKWLEFVEEEEEDQTTEG